MVDDIFSTRELDKLNIGFRFNFNGMCSCSGALKA